MGGLKGQGLGDNLAHRRQDLIRPTRPIACGWVVCCFCLCPCPLAPPGTPPPTCLCPCICLPLPAHGSLPSPCQDAGDLAEAQAGHILPHLSARRGGGRGTWRFRCPHRGVTG